MHRIFQRPTFVYSKQLLACVSARTAALITLSCVKDLPGYCPTHSLRMWRMRRRNALACGDAHTQHGSSERSTSLNPGQVLSQCQAVWGFATLAPGRTCRCWQNDFRNGLPRRQFVRMGIWAAKRKNDTAGELAYAGPGCSHLH